jgi:hypothetical protein
VAASGTGALDTVVVVVVGGSVVVGGTVVVVVGGKVVVVVVFGGRARCKKVTAATTKSGRNRRARRLESLRGECYVAHGGGRTQRTCPDDRRSLKAAAVWFDAWLMPERCLLASHGVRTAI